MGWIWASLEQLCFLDVGFAFKSEEFVDEGVPLLRGANIEPGALKWDDKRCWPEEKVEPFKHLTVNEGDIILAMDRPLISSGLKIARAKSSDTPCLLVQRVARFKPLDEHLNGFLYLSTQTQRFVNHLLGGQTGTQLPHISGSGILSFITPLPPLAEQKIIVDEAERLLSLTDDVECTITNELRRSERLRQGILKRAFEGKLVPQNPADEPVSALLKQIREQQSDSTTKGRKDEAEKTATTDLVGKQLSLNL